MMAVKDVDYSLYLVTDSTPAILGDKDLVSVVQEAVAGGRLRVFSHNTIANAFAQARRSYSTGIRNRILLSSSKLPKSFTRSRSLLGAL